MKKILLLPLAAAALAAQPAGAATAPMHGIVVGAQRGGLMLVAGPKGVVQLVHGRARVGARVDVRAARILRVHGLAARTAIRGIVIRRSNGVTFLSVAHRVVVLHHAGRRLSSTADGSIAPGDVVSAIVAFTGGGLAEQDVTDLGHADGATVQATIAAVGADSITLSVNGQTLTIPLPPGVTVPATAVGSQLSLKLDFSGTDTTADPEDQSGSEDNSGDSGQNSGPVSPNSGPGDQGSGDDQSGDDQSGDVGDQGDQGETTDDQGQPGDDQSGDDQGQPSDGGSGDHQGQSGGGDHGGDSHGSGGSGGDGGGND